MRALLDTHAFLWWVDASPRLSAAARDVIADGSNEILLSAAVAYEIALKVAAGRLDLPTPVEEYLPVRIESEGFDPLAVSVAHALRAAALPPIHRDPFDRLLIAQAQLEGVSIVTVDPIIARYDVATIW
jgi:PIN domain nuclease of toxin-antitoxin system